MNPIGFVIMAINLAAAVFVCWPRKTNFGLRQMTPERKQTAEAQKQF